MSTPTSRAAVFLAEMGIAPLWTLRGALDADASPADVGQSAHADSGAASAQAGAAPAIASTQAAAANPRAGAAPTAANTRPVSAADPQAGAAPTAASARAAANLQADAGAASDAAWTDAAAAPPSDADIGAMNWGQLRAAVAACTRCGLCRDGRKPVFGSGAQTAQWAVVAGVSSALDQQERQPMSGEPGALLSNMLAAVGLARESNVYVTNLIKGRPVNANGAERAPTAEEAAACRPYAEREIALSGARLILTVGQIAANGMLDQPLATPLSGTRGSVHERAGTPLVATLHPGELLLRGADKAQAWADLCLASAARDGAA